MMRRRIWPAALLWFSLLSIGMNVLSGSALAFDRSVFDNLDYGIYWYGDQLVTQKAVSGVANPYYANAQPTLIYIHGWQNGKTPLLYRETFARAVDGGPTTDLTGSWKLNGWNMGIFYWNQFSDEGDVNDAEAKIWTASGAKQMRWRKADGSYVNSGITSSAAQLFLDSYKSAMAGYTGNDVRLAGHSLGSEMVVVGAKLISDAVDRGEIPANLRPRRVVLLDPAFIGGQRAYLGNRQTVEVGGDYIDAMKAKGIIFESINTSGASSGSVAVMNRTAYRELKAWYFSAFDVVGKHMAAVWHYLWEYQYTAANIVGTSTRASSASTSNSATQSLMNATQRQIHDQGAWTKSPSDDTYKWTNK